MWRIVWQYGGSGLVPSARGAARLEELRESTAPMLADVPLVAPVEPVFSAAPARLRAMTRALPEESVAAMGDLAAYHHAFVEGDDWAEILKERFGNEPGVSYFHLEQRPRTAAVSTPDLQSHQGYLDAAPVGVSAEAAWSIPGGRGDGVQIFDVEWGWNFGHEDLIDRSLGVVHGPSLIDDHGTSVVGILGADDNGRGMKGVAHGAQIGGASAELPQGRWNVEDAILGAARQSFPGDVILLELETFDSKPYESVKCVFDIIQTVTAGQRYFIEPAGNGGLNLDGLGIGTADSGAILVGAGGAGLQSPLRTRMSFSNFGSRVDVQGWGEGVATCGGLTANDLQSDPDAGLCYTGTFAGTSSASAIVAGVVACISGALRAAAPGAPPLLPNLMRTLLRRHGTAQDPVNDPRIGPLPDLQQIFQQLGFI
jgi:hypothetical protein